MDSKKAVEQMARLRARFLRSPQITKLDEPGREEAETLSHALVDLDEASEEYRQKFRKLLDSDISGDELVLELIDLAMTLQHMRYHMEDSRFLVDITEPPKS